MTIYRLELKITSHEPVSVSGVPAIRVSIAAQNAENVEPEVFLMRRLSTGSDELVTFCAVSDMSNYPNQPPGADDEYVYHRASSVEFVDDSPERVAEFIENMQRRATALLDALKEIDDFPEETVLSFEA